MGKPRNHGNPWSTEDYMLLNDMWDSKRSLLDMAKELGRTASSVCAQLAVRGDLYYNTCKQAYFPKNPPPFATTYNIRKVDKQMEQDNE